MAPIRRARGASGASSASGVADRGRGARAPCVTRCRRGRGGFAGSASTAVVDEGVCSHDFVIYILSRIAGQIPLPSYFSSFVSELGLDSLRLCLQRYPHCLLWVPIRVESSSLVFLESGWRVFARQFN